MSALTTDQPLTLEGLAVGIDLFASLDLLEELERPRLALSFSASVAELGEVQCEFHFACLDAFGSRARRSAACPCCRCSARAAIS
jgi:hypothetical protein